MDQPIGAKDKGYMETGFEQSLTDPLPQTAYQVDPTVGEFAVSAGMSALLVIITFTIFFETMRWVWRHMDKVSHRPRVAVYIGILAIFACHTICVWLYGMTYWVLIEYWDFGDLRGQFEKDYFLSYIYFSVTTYSSLGYGDIFPFGPLRLLTGVEAVNGLVLIGWSTTYTYFAAERYMAHEKKPKTPHF